VARFQGSLEPQKFGEGKNKCNCLAALLASLLRKGRRCGGDR
jgi:hypothetical protein